MKDRAPAAERTWFAIAPDGSECTVTIRVAVPIAQSGGEWTAGVSLLGLEARSHSIAGFDAWQATSLAMQFASTRIGHFMEDGWRFYWERGGEAAQLSELVAGV